MASKITIFTSLVTKLKFEISFLSAVHLVAGGMGGTVGAILTCPLEVVKTRLQSSCANFDQVAVNRQPRYVHIFLCAKLKQLLNYKLHRSLTFCFPVSSAISGINVAHQHVPNHMGIYKCLKTIWEQEGRKYRIPQIRR